MDDSSRDDDFSLANEDNRINYNVPALRNARELHLMAEEKWIIEALNKIKQQRNALKVEYLYFQGLKADLLNSHGIRFDDSSQCIQNNIQDDDVDLSVDHSAYEPTICGISSRDHDKCEDESQKERPVLSDQTALDVVSAASSNVEDFQILEEQCNTQQLQLNVKSPPNQCKGWDIEDPETESDEEEEEWSKVNLDMEMLVGHNRADM